MPFAGAGCQQASRLEPKPACHNQEQLPPRCPHRCVESTPPGGCLRAHSPALLEVVVQARSDLARYLHRRNSCNQGWAPGRPAPLLGCCMCFASADCSREPRLEPTPTGYNQQWLVPHSPHRCESHSAPPPGGCLQARSDPLAAGSFKRAVVLLGIARSGTSYQREPSYTCGVSPTWRPWLSTRTTLTEPRPNTNTTHAFRRT